MNEWLKKKVLITVKAYPNPSKKYGEAVCVAGIDIDKKQWVRLYPVPFRDLDDKQKFKKYTIIEVKATKPSDDKRPESYKIDSGSIKIIEQLDTKDRWNRRKSIIFPTISKSMCEILKNYEIEDKSLGMFKPININFVWEKAIVKYKNDRESYYAQLSFFNRQKNTPEIIPFDFRYKFYCYDESNCQGHDYSIVDWEIAQAYRDWRWKYKPEELLLNKIKERWLDRICNPKNDIYFYVGNLKRFRDKFMILGIFYPPKLDEED